MTLGLNHLERVVCSCFGAVAYSDLPLSGHGMNEAELGEVRRNARYYALSNGLRTLVLVIVTFGLRNLPGIPLAFGVIGSAFHGLLTVVEWYRFRLLANFSAGSAAPHKSVVREYPDLHPFFGPFAWEREWIYYALGVQWAALLLKKYKWWARDESSVRLGPQITPQPNRAFAIETIVQSRQAELVHLAGIAFDAVVLCGTIKISFAWCIIPILGIVLDSEMVLLQRLHRVRLRKLHRRKQLLKTASGTF